MNRIISLFLFIFIASCLNGQYNSPIRNKVTLGKQTTADGLVWRGRLADTANLLTNKLDTSVYIVLDTGTRAMWYYRASTTPKWTRLVDSLNNLQGQLSLTTKVTGVLPVANGGTGADMSSLPNNYLVRKNSSGIFDTSLVYEAGGKVGIGLIPDIKLHIASPIGSDFLQYTENVTFKTPRFGVQVTSGYGKLLFNSYNIPTYLSSGKAGGTGGIVAIQTGVLGSEVERFRINEDGEVGIGTDNPNATLEVYKSSAAVVDAARFGGNFGYATFNNYGDLLGTIGTTKSLLTAAYTTNTAGFGTYSDSDLAIFTNITRRATVKNTGEFGIGTASPAVQFHTTGGVRFAGLASITDLRTDADGDLFNGSDFNLKNSIDTINFGLSDVLKLKPVSFNWNDEQRNINEYKSMGFIAQDVMNIIPNAASTMGDGDMQVDYNAIVATLTKAIQEQTIIIKQLEDRIKKLEEK